MDQPALPQTKPAYASLLVRLAAFVIDHLLIYFSAYLTIAGAAGLHGYFHGTQLAGEIRFMIVSLLFYCAFYIVYFVYFLTRGGQTPGKQALGIKVVALDGKEVDGLRGILRTAGYGLSSLFFGLGFLWAFFDRRRQGWHDKLAGTVVLEI